MSVFFGIPVSNRQASIEFSVRGLNYRKAHAVSEVDMRIACPLRPFEYHAFRASIPHLIASASLGHPVIQSSPLFGFKLSDLNTLKTVSSVLSFATTAILSDTLVRKHNLIFKNPGGRYTSGYYTQHPISFDDIKAFAEDFPTGSAVVRSSGVSGIGMSLTAASSFICLSRIVRAYLECQVGDFMPGTIGPDVHDGSIETVVVACEGDKRPSFDEDGVLVIGQDWIDNYQLDHKYNSGWIQCTSSSVNTFVSLPGTLKGRMGHPFEFVESSLPADRGFLRTLLYRHFAHLFSIKNDVSSKAIGIIVDNLLPISRHPHGQELLHILATIQLAIDCGGKVILIQDRRNRLLGTVLSTTEPLIIGNGNSDALDSDSLSEAVKSWTTSEGARILIAERLSTLDLAVKTGKQTVITSSDIETHHALCAAISIRVRMSAITPTLLSAIRLSDYSHKWLAATEENITIMLLNIASRKVPDTFMVNESLFLEQDLCLVANLSLFGPKSVSFMNAGGKLMDVYLDKDEDPAKGKKKKVVMQKVRPGKKGKKVVETTETDAFVWDRICVSRVSVHEAVKDFEAFRNGHRIMQVQAYDTKLLGNLDVHNISNGNSEMLTALRRFGGTVEDFLERKKTRQEFQAVQLVDDGVETDDEIEDFGF